jgi:hypothetical protein
LIWIKPERPERQYLYFEYRFGAGAMPEECNAITEETLRALVTAFYARVRQDPELGPIFNDAISDWPHHLSKLTDFWHSVMLTRAVAADNQRIDGAVRSRSLAGQGRTHRRQPATRPLLSPRGAR